VSPPHRGAGSAGGAFGTRPGSQPFAIRAGQPFQLSTAQRYDVLIEPDREWVFTVPFEFRHWIRGTAYRYAETTITVE
jgi:hypothetical protein